MMQHMPFRSLKRTCGCFLPERLSWASRWTRATLARFARFARLLEEGNRRLNLTRIRLMMWSRCIFSTRWRSPPSIFLRLAHWFWMWEPGRGFPVCLWHLRFQNADVTLMDSTNKRLAFIDHVLADLKVTNARTLHARAEELARDPLHRERYDLVVARAVAPLSTLAGWLLPFARPGGLVAAYKSQNAQEEIETRHTYNCATWRRARTGGRHHPARIPTSFGNWWLYAKNALCR